MDLNQLKQILDLVRAHDLAEFEIEHDGLRLKIRKDAAGAPAVVASSVPAPSAPAAAPAAASASAAPSATPSGSTGPTAADAGEADVELAVVKSPIVGTFYRSPEPGAPPFVEIGSQVKKGQVLCIIEAMKLMNEIESDVDGVVARIYPQNGQPIEYGEKLFAVTLS